MTDKPDTDPYATYDDGFLDGLKEARRVTERWAGRIAVSEIDDLIAYRASLIRRIEDHNTNADYERAKARVVALRTTKGASDA